MSMRKRNKKVEMMKGSLTRSRTLETKEMWKKDYKFIRDREREEKWEWGRKRVHDVQGRLLKRRQTITVSFMLKNT